MKELKFRAWDKRFSKLEPWDDAYIATWFWHPEDFDIMQYTGLRDRNGVEIYEGDIIRQKYGDTVEVKYGIQEVDAFEGMGYNLWSFQGDNPDGTRLSSECEVIGNIFESSDLLENPHA